MNITAAVTHARGSAFSIEELHLADPGEHEVVVRIAGVGLCHTDLAARDGALPVSYPIVLGHEGAGTVLAVGHAVTNVSEGDHVAISFDSCGRCRTCRRGSAAYCLEFRGLNYGGGRADGSPVLRGPGGAVTGNFFGQSSFATHVLAHGRNVVRIEKDVPLELAGPLGCGLQTGAGAVMNAMVCEQGSALLVLGGGPVGLAAVMAGAIRGCQSIIVCEPQRARRELALKLGATETLDPREMLDLVDAVRSIVPGGVDYALDTAAKPAVVESLPGLMAHRGTIGLVGLPAEPSSSFPLRLTALLQPGLSIRGIVEGDAVPEQFIPEMLNHWRSGRFPFEELITTFPLSEINAAVAAHEAGDAVKVVLVPDPS